MNLIEELLEQNDAESVLRALAGKADTTERLLWKARALGILGRQGEAEEIARGILLSEPAQPWAHCVLGSLLSQKGRAREGLEHLNQALAFAPKEPRFLLHRARVFVALSELEQALADQKTVVELGRLDLCFAELVSTLCRLEQWEEAGALLERHRDSMPLSQLYPARVQWELATQHPQEALKAALEWKAAMPDEVAPWHLSLQLLVAFQAQAPLVELAGEALLVHPASAELLNLVAPYLEAAGQGAKLVGYLRAALDKAPAKLGALSDSVGAAVRSGATKEVVDLLDQALAREPRQPLGWVLRASFAADSEELQRYLGPVAESEEPEALFEGASLCASGGVVDFGLVLIDKAIALDSSRFACHHTRGLLLQRGGRLEEAIEAYGVALHLCPTSHETMNNRGNCYREQGDLERALSDYRAASLLAPEHVEAPFNMAVGLLEAERSAEARGLLDQVLALQPGHSGALYFRGLLLFREGKTEEADRFYQEACRGDARFLERPYLLPDPAFAPPVGPVFDLEFLNDAAQRTLDLLEPYLLNIDDSSEILKESVLMIAFVAVRLAAYLSPLELEPFSSSTELGQRLERVVAPWGQDYPRVRAALLEKVAEELVGPDRVLRDRHTLEQILDRVTVQLVEVVGSHAGRDWQAQEKLWERRLQALGARASEHRLDFRRGLFFRIRGSKTLAVADFVLLGSYHAQTASLMAGWANPNALLERARPPRVLGFQDQHSGMTQSGALHWAASVADQLPQIEVLSSLQEGPLTHYLGAWNLRAPGRDEVYDKESERQASHFAVKAIDSLLAEGQAGQVAEKLVQAAELFLEQCSLRFGGTAPGAQLEVTARRLQRLAEAWNHGQTEECRQVLGQLRERWAALGPVTPSR